MGISLWSTSGQLLHFLTMQEDRSIAALGIFITTAEFSKEAEAYAAKQLHSKIVLVDGERLMKLMIEFDLGVSIVHAYLVKRIDSDFFSDDV